MSKDYQFVKMIWDFRGPEATKIAEHHRIHLDDYIRMQKLQQCHSGIEKQSDMHHIAYMVVPRDQVPDLKAQLKPHRGQIYQES